MTIEWFWAAAGAIIGLLLGAILTWLATIRTLNQQKTIWTREKLLQAYSDCIYYLFKLQISSGTAGPMDKDVRQHLSESQRFLTLLSAYQPDATTKQDIEQANKALQTAATSKNGNISQEAGNAQTVVVTAMQKDPRVNLL